jgi:hypothetical protein
MVRKMIADDMRFYGLLYIDERNNKNSNLGRGIDPIDIYIRCASLCSKAFRSAGAAFHLITNNEQLVRQRLAIMKLADVVVLGHGFSLTVPKKVPFYSAHFKLDLLHSFGRGELGQRIGLIDLDTVLLRRLPFSASLAAYDISDQVFPAYGKHRVVSDLELVSGRSFSNPRWYGGEFVTGSAADFAIISHYMSLCWPRYLTNISSLHHNSDEMALSCALNMARADGVEIVDYGQARIVARWWTTHTRHKQPPFDSVTGAALLHLPADKVFLSREADYQFDSIAFLSRFRPYARKRILRRAVSGAAATLLRKQEKSFIPRLSYS